MIEKYYQIKRFVKKHRKLLTIGIIMLIFFIAMILFYIDMKKMGG